MIDYASMCVCACMCVYFSLCFSKFYMHEKVKFLCLQASVEWVHNVHVMHEWFQLSMLLYPLVQKQGCSDRSFFKTSLFCI